MAKKRKKVSEREAKRRKEQAQHSSLDAPPKPGASEMNRGTGVLPHARRQKTGRGKS